MRIAPVRPAIFQLTLSVHELSALIAAARWVVQGAQGEMDPVAPAQLENVLAGYDAARARSGSRPASAAARSAACEMPGYRVSRRL